MGISKTAISEMGGITQHTLLRVVGTISGCSVGRGNTEKLRGVAKLFNYESNQENWQEKENAERKKSVAEFEVGNAIIQHSDDTEKSIKNSKIQIKRTGMAYRKVKLRIL